MTIKEMINALEYHIENADMPLSNGDAITIVQALKDYDELTKVHTQWHKDLMALDTVSDRLHWKMKDLLDALVAR